MTKIYSQDSEERPTVNDLLSNKWLMSDIAS